MPFKCSSCTKEFSRRASLRNHIKVHNDTIENILWIIAEEREREILMEKESSQLGNNNEIEIYSQLEDDDKNEIEIDRDKVKIEIDRDDEVRIEIDRDNEGGIEIDRDNEGRIESILGNEQEDYLEGQSESEIVEISDQVMVIIIK